MGKSRKLCVFVSLTALLFSCSSDEEDAIQFATVKSDKTVQLSNDVNSPSCNVHLELAYATDDNGHKAEIINNAIESRLLDIENLPMQQAADSFASVYATNYKKNFLPLYNQDRGDESKRSWYEYHYIIKSEAGKGHKASTAYNIYLDYYEGGAHGIIQHLTMNFENKTGRTLSLADIFVPGYEHQLNVLLLNALQEKTGCRNITELHDKGYLYSMDMFPSENFILSDDNITFIYNPYEIAPYAAGTTELTITYSSLDNILKNSFAR